MNRFEDLQGAFVASELVPWLNRNVDRYGLALRYDSTFSDAPASRFGLDADSIRTREFSNLLIERRRLINLVTLFRGQTLDRMTNLRDWVDRELSDA